MLQILAIALSVLICVVAAVIFLLGVMVLGFKHVEKRLKEYQHDEEKT